jgi:hypothetical protein
VSSLTRLDDTIRAEFWVKCPVQIFYPRNPLHSLVRVFAVLALVFLSFSSAQAQPRAKRAPIQKAASAVLYNPALGTMPDAQGWSLLTIGGTETPPGKLGIATTFSTLTADSIQGGYLLLAPRSLDRKSGYALTFALQVVEEHHTPANRAGVSLIVLGADGKGIELAFWPDQIWAQSDLPLFHHAEGAAIHTRGSGTDSLVQYRLAISGDRYHLVANGQPLLTGPLRDYRAFQGPIDPYQTPNLIFLGDDTKAASGEMRMGKITLTTLPHDLATAQPARAAAIPKWTEHHARIARANRVDLSHVGIHTDANFVEFQSLSVNLGGIVARCLGPKAVCRNLQIVAHCLLSTNHAALPPGLGWLGRAFGPVPDQYGSIDGKPGWSVKVVLNHGAGYAQVSIPSRFANWVAEQKPALRARYLDPKNYWATVNWEAFAIMAKSG